MKKLIYLFCISFLLINCGSDDSSDSDDIFGGLNDGYLRADVNGATLEFNLGPNSVAAALVDGGITGEAFTFSIGATTSGFTETLPVETISFLLFTDNPNIPSGNLSFDENDNLLGSYTYTEDLDIGPAIEAGTALIGEVNLNITSVNQQSGTISGTFNFDAIDSISGDAYTITNGVFNNIIFINDSSAN
jgi:hypothetical protein